MEENNSGYFVSEHSVYSYVLWIAMYTVCQKRDSRNLEYLVQL